MAEVKFSEFPASGTITSSKVVGLNPSGENAQFDATAFKGDTGDTGATGPQGDPGTPAQVDAGTTTTSAPGTNASVNNVGTPQDAVFNFTIPRGDVGATGATGDTGPQGAKGDQGDAGAAATVGVDSTVTLPPGSPAEVTNVGTSSAASFVFSIPQGAKGDQGDAGSGYNLRGDASVAELNALTGSAIATNDAWQMTNSGTVQPIGALQGTPVITGDLVVWAEADYFVNYGQATGSGDVIGPASSVANRIATYSDTTGKLIKDSGILATSLVAGPASVTSGRIATFSGTSGKVIAQGTILASSIVTGPASTVSGNIATYSGTTGKVITNSGAKTTDFATAAQGALAGTAIQPSDVFTGPGSVGLIPDPGVASNKFLDANGDWVEPNYSPVGGLSLLYVFSTSTSASNPGTANVRLNNIDQTIATEIYISSTTAYGNVIDAIWRNYTEGDAIGLWERATARESDYYQITGKGIDEGGWWRFPVSFISGPGGIDNGVLVDVAPIVDSDMRIPTGGTAGQVLTKISTTNYDSEWRDPSTNGLEAQWLWDDSTIMADPGATFMRGNQSSMDAITQFAASTTTVDGPVSPVDIKVGDTIIVLDEDRAAYGRFYATAVDHTDPDWSLLTCTPDVDNSGNPLGGNRMSVAWIPTGAGSSGDVNGPASAVDNNIATFDGTTGKLIQDGGISSASFATAAQGTLAGTAIQPADNITELNNNAGFRAYYSGTGLPPAAGYVEGDLFMVYTP